MSTSPLGLVSFCAIFCFAGIAQGQIYVTDPGGGVVGEYNLDGTAISSSFIQTQITAVAVSGGDLFATTFGNGTSTGTIGEYNAATGNSVQVPLVNGLADPTSLAISGNDNFVTNYSNGTVDEFTTSGSSVGSSPLISGLNRPTGVVVSGSDLFVAEQSGTIAEYTTSGILVPTFSLTLGSDLNGLAISGNDLFVTESSSTGYIGEYTTSGATVKAQLVTGLRVPQQLSVLGDDIFVVNQGNGTVGEYTTSGDTVATSLISNFEDPFGIDAIPEPSTWILTGIGFAAVAFARRRSTLSSLRQ
jgi:hypothetical protein